MKRLHARAHERARTRIRMKKVRRERGGGGAGGTGRGDTGRTGGGRQAAAAAAAAAAAKGSMRLPTKASSTCAHHAPAHHTAPRRTSPRRHRVAVSSSPRRRRRLAQPPGNLKMIADLVADRAPRPGYNPRRPLEREARPHGSGDVGVGRWPVQRGRKAGRVGGSRAGQRAERLRRRWDRQVSVSKRACARLAAHDARPWVALHIQHGRARHVRAAAR